MGRRLKEPEDRSVKTTISIDPELYRQTKEACIEREETFSRFFADALRTRLALNGERPAASAAVRRQIKELYAAIKKLAQSLDVNLEDE